MRDTLRMDKLFAPALDPATVPEQHGSTYPEPFRSRMGDRAKRRSATRSVSRASA